MCEILNGQMSIFDLEEKEEIKIDITKEQQDIIDKLKEKDWIEYSLYDNGIVVFLVKEPVNIKVVPLGDVEKEYTIKDKYKSYFIKENGETDCSFGLTRWNDPIKNIKRGDKVDKYINYT